MAEAARTDATWHDAVIRALKDNNVRLVVYVPDNVLRPLIEAVNNDEFFTAFVCAREEEAVGIVCGAAMAGLKGIVLMQSAARSATSSPARRSSAAPCVPSCNRSASSITR